MPQDGIGNPKGAWKWQFGAWEWQLGIKNGVGFKNPRRRDIAPTGELAGLPARDSPKPMYCSHVGISEVRGPSCQKTTHVKCILYNRRCNFFHLSKSA
jgi:hypothetical protein